MSFDITAPTVSAPSSGGTTVTDGRVFTSASDYRPTFTWTVSDAHSGVAAITTRIDGANVSNSYSGGVVTMTPATRLALGTRTLTVITTDAVGNSTTVNRSIVVRDDVLPTVSVAAPAANGANSPLLDVTAADDYSGVDTSTWRVFVNGVQMATAVGSTRLQADIGRLVNGTHQIEVRVKDLAGNERVHTISHVASSDSRTPPGIHGIYVIAPPSVVREADVVRFEAAIVKAGRPQAGTRVELRRGSVALTSAIVAADGYVDLPVRIDDAGDLTLVADGTGLAPRTITFQFIPDTAPPTLRIDKPVASGESSPLLDVTAFDTQSGVAPSTWAVKVNGVPIAASSESERLQVSLGRLANGTHQIEVSVSDRRGNQHSETISYQASGDAYTAPGKTGIYILTSPEVVDEGIGYRVTVIAVKDGRPIETGRYEILRLAGDDTILAGKLIGPDGYADMLITDPTPGAMVLRLTGSTLASVQYSYTFRKAGEPEFCQAHPAHAACVRAPGDPVIGGGTGTGTTTNNTTTTTTTTNNTTNVGTSGGPDDKVAPKFTLKVVQTAKGVVLRKKQIVLRMTSNERANYTLLPIGNRRATSVAMRAQTKVLRITLTGALLKRIQATKTRYVMVPIRVVGIDGNKNIVRKTLRLRVQR